MIAARSRPHRALGAAVAIGLPFVAGMANSDPLDGWWRVSRVEHVAVPALSQKRSYLVFHGGQFYGSDGCSGISGGYEWAATELHTTPGLTTADACRSATDPDLMRRAERIQTLVFSADGFRRRGAKLLLLVQGVDVLDLMRAPDADRISVVGDSTRRMVVLNDPRWAERPSADQLSKARSDPSVGADRSMQLLCAISSKGALTDCELLYPPTRQAQSLRIALYLTEIYRLSPADTRLAKRNKASILLNINL